MNKCYMKAICLFVGLVAILLTGCAPKDTPSGAVLRFFKAVRVSDRVELENILSFERLIVERDGEKYVALSPQDKSAATARLKEDMFSALTIGDLKVAGKVDPVVRGERISGDKAEVVISERKNKDKAYMFSLAREGGVWKIYSIVAL